MIKIDMHMHTGDDPKDGLRYTATELIDKAVALGFAAIAITLHGKVLEDPRLTEYARARGLLLIPAVEWRFENCDVLVYNVRQAEMESLRTFADLRALRARRGDNILVIAPHPFFPAGHSLGRKLEPHIELFDALEYSHMHLRGVNPNNRAVLIAKKHGKPIIANSDTHNLWMFGEHFTLVDAEPTMPSIFQAIRAGRVEWQSPPRTVRDCLRFFITDPLFIRRKGEILPSFGAPKPSP